MRQLYQLVHMQGPMDYIPIAKFQGEDPALLLFTIAEKLFIDVVPPGIYRSYP